MVLTPLTALSPLDGRYHNRLQPLADYFSEYALIRYRLLVEVEYFIFLAEKKFFPLPKKTAGILRKLVEDFSVDAAIEIKNIETSTNHDVKAVEYFLKKKLTSLGHGDICEWVHFGLTSQDINNTAIPLMWKQAMETEILPATLNLHQHLLKLAQQWKDIPMLARTHGQPATPVRLGKELMVFVERLESQIELISFIPFSGKFGGATGGMNAHYAAFPKYDWITFANSFMEDRLGLQRQQYTTQIEHYDNLCAHFDNLKRINTILTDCCRDFWTYISMDYFKQQVNKNEVGSSAMPHKVNPIDFENAEGNFGIANALYEHLSAKLPISRLQRDLTDSTVIRNIGVPAAHSLLAMDSMERGLRKLNLNKEKIQKDLSEQWAVIAEAIQTILRRERYPEAYEALKTLTRGKTIDKKSLRRFIDTLKVKPSVKAELRKITPENYLGKP